MLDLFNEERTGVPQLDVAHSTDELLHQAIHPLAGLFGDFVDRLHPTSRDPHEQQVKTPKQRTRHQRGDRFKQKKAGGDDYGDEEPCREVAKWRQEKRP